MPDRSTAWSGLSGGTLVHLDVRADDLLLVLTGTWTQAVRLPPPPGLPTVRAFQRRVHDAALAWARRRADAGLARPL